MFDLHTLSHKRKGKFKLIFFQTCLRERAWRLVGAPTRNSIRSLANFWQFVLRSLYFSYFLFHSLLNSCMSSSVLIVTPVSVKVHLIGLFFELLIFRTPSCFKLFPVWLTSWQSSPLAPILTAQWSPLINAALPPIHTRSVQTRRFSMLLAVTGVPALNWHLRWVTASLDSRSTPTVTHCGMLTGWWKLMKINHKAARQTDTRTMV